MRVVFDTVVLVRGLLDDQSWWGRLVFDAADLYELIVSPSIVDEYLDVLHRPRLTKKYRHAADRDLTRVLDLVENATAVHPMFPPAVCRDPNDDKFLAAAKAGGAHFLISEDADLLELGSYEETAIVRANEFLRILDT